MAEQKDEEANTVTSPAQSMISAEKETGSTRQSDLTRIKTEPPPDGGREAWLVVLGAWCISFCSFGWLNSIAVFQEYYQNNLLRQYTTSEVAWIPSLQIFFMLFSGIFVGWVFDRYGPRYLIAIGSFLHVFGLMMLSISRHYYSIMLTQGICSAIGCSMIYQPAIGAVSGFFDKKKASAFGVVFTGSSIGGVIFPIMVSHLLREVGFGWSMRICAFIILFLLAVANLTVKCRIQPTPAKLSRADLTKPFHELGLVLVLAGYAILTFGVFVPINFIVVDARAQGMSANLAQYVPSILNALSFFGRAGAGILGDKLGRYNVFIFVCYLSGILILALWLPAQGNGANIVFAALFGFSSGAYISLSPALIAQVSPYKEIGYRLGLLFFFSSFMGLTASPIAGAIVQDQDGSFTGAKIFSGVMAMAGTTLVLVARVHKVGFNPTAKF